jgi:hypothetical protein
VEALDPIDLTSVKGKIVLLTAGIRPGDFKKLIDAGVVGVITPSGTFRDTKDTMDLDERMLRDRHIKDGRLPSVCMRMTDAMDMVEYMRQIAFCVQDGTIVKVNTAASNRMIEPGTSVEQLLKTGAEEYRDFSGGCLYLSLNICDQELGFSVSRQNGFDLFQLEQDAQSYELQSLALAARELREPLANIMISTDQLFPDSSDDPTVNSQIARLNQGLFQILRLISNMSDAGRYAVSGAVSMEVKTSALCWMRFSTKPPLW